jgi:hypothetical protein
MPKETPFADAVAGAPAGPMPAPGAPGPADAAAEVVARLMNVIVRLPPDVLALFVQTLVEYLNAQAAQAGPAPAGPMPAGPMTPPVR